MSSTQPDAPRPASPGNPPSDRVAAQPLKRPADMDDNELAAEIKRIEDEIAAEEAEEAAAKSEGITPADLAEGVKDEEANADKLRRITRDREVCERGEAARAESAKPAVAAKPVAWERVSVNKAQKIVILTTAATVAAVLLVSALSLYPCRMPLPNDWREYDYGPETGQLFARVQTHNKTVVLWQTLECALAISVLGGALVFYLHNRKPS